VRAHRDIVTTRTGKLTIALSRFAPGRFVDHVIRTSFRRNLRGRLLDGASAAVIEFAERLE
jgi:hypothetical protein